MCECGCVSGNQVFKLKAPDGWYIFQMNPGCDYCCVGPTMHVSMPEASRLYYKDEFEHIPVLSTIGEQSEAIAVIKCGISKDQAVNAAIKTMVGVDTGNDGVIDEVFAEVLGEDLWKDALTSPPSVIYPHKKELSGAMDEPLCPYCKKEPRSKHLNGDCP